MLEPEEDTLPVTRTEGFLHMTVHRAIDLVAKVFTQNILLIQNNIAKIDF